jgi:SM-20-related protein
MDSNSDQPIAIRIVLINGQSYETTCRPGSPLLQQIVSILTHQNRSTFLHIEIGEAGGSRGLTIPVNAIVAVETNPAVAFDRWADPEPIERAPYIRIPSFLTADENRHLLNYAVEQRANFVRSTLDVETPDYRESLLLPRFGDLGIDLEGRIEEILPELFAHFQIEPPTQPSLETQFTTHNDGGYLKIHNDNGSAVTSSRVLTYVYYFFRQPAAFRGGQLRIYDSKIKDNFWVAADTYVDIEPENNMMLFFPSRLVHEVLPIACPSRKFADGRFTLNGWVKKQSPSTDAP